MLTLLQLSSVRSRSRHKGQALILAVFVMLFAVLLSSAFLVVIGNNGRQVGRETDKSEASRNADKGVAFVVSRLQAVANTDSWDASTDAVLASGGVPVASSTDYDLYYSQLDKTMNWAGDRYAKYPDPRRSRQAPQFLVSSRLLGPAAIDNADGGDKRFMLRITVIGLSSKNPEAWSRRVLYKTTKWNGGTFSYANFVTSFDPDAQKPIVSALAADTPANPALGSEPTIRVYGAKGQGNERVEYSRRIAEVGNTLMLSDGAHQPVVGIVKVAAQDTTTSIYNLTIRVLQAGTAAGNFSTNAKVALVGSLFETPSNVDENGDGNGVPAANEGEVNSQSLPSVRTDTNNTDYRPFGNGSQFNEGLNVPVTTVVGGRVPEARNYLNGTTTAVTYAGQNSLSSSGPVSVGDPTPIPAGTPLGIRFASPPIGTAPTPAPAFVAQPAPASNQFLRVSYTESGVASVEQATSPVAPVIAPRSVKPAPLDVAFYRAKALAISTPANPNLFLINNSEDVEKFNGQPLSANQLQRLWQRKSFPVTTGGNILYTGTNVAIQAPAAGTPGVAARLCYGRPGVDQYIYPMPTGGLEAQGIRGWISPWEFLPRGAQIILNGTTITVVHDPLSDSSPNAPDLSKAIDATKRVFSSINIAPPANGIIVADGNLRVKGTWTGIPLTIVSNNNIYIEGSIQAAVGQVALLAKKNVVLNPTQFVGRPDGTVDTSVGKTAFLGKAQNGDVQLTSGIDSFKFGDKVAVFARNVKADGWHTVTSINAVTKVLTLTPPLDANTGNFVNGADVKVKLACDPPIVLIAKANKVKGAATNGIPTNEYFVPTTVGGTEEANTTEEFTPATLPANTPATWAYRFSVGGDTLARKVPFGGTIGLAMSQAAAKKVIRFSVRGGDATDPGDPGNPAKEDDGKRQLLARDQNLFNLKLTPKSGAIRQQDTFNLQDLDDNSSQDGDANASFNALNQIFIGRDNNGDRDKSRWRVEDLVDAQNNPTSIAAVASRRLAKAAIDPTVLSLPPNSLTAGPEEAPNPATIFRAPLTSSVLLFNTDLPEQQPVANWVTLLNIGSSFGYRSDQDPAITTEDATTTDAAFYGNTPIWNIPNSTTTDGTVTYAQRGTNDTFAFTRDGSGDFDGGLPAYYLSAVRFQKVDTAGSSGVYGTSPYLPTGTTEKSNLNIEVDATIYAEGGSWFIIPVPATVASNAGLGTSQQIEWRRPAYDITINGNITQMATPSATVDYDNEPDPDGVAIGAMLRWTDSLAYQIQRGGTTSWQTIRYNAAPLPLADTTGTPVQLPLLPSSPDILYTYSN